MMLGSALLLGLSCLTCAHQVITAPDGQKALASLVPAASDSACRVVRVQLLSGGPQVTWPDRTTCGTGLTLISGGAPSLVDGDNRTVKFPLRVLNRGNDPMLEPVRVIYTPGAVEVIGSGSPGDVSAHVGDSLFAGGGLLWRVGTTHTIAVGDSTAAKTIYLRLEHPTADAKVALGVEAMVQDTARPPVPDAENLPGDSTETLKILVADRPYSFYRRIFEIQFHDSTSGSTIFAVLSRYSAEIVGGHPSARPYTRGVYYIRVPSPGPSTLTGLDSLVAEMNAEPGIAFASKTIFSTQFRPFYRLPRDGGGTAAADWRRTPRTLSTWAWWAVEAPSFWGCEVGASSLAAPAVGVMDFLLDNGHPDFAGSVIKKFVPKEVVPGSLTDPSLSNMPNYIPPIGRSHGTAVSGILMATGDNQTGIAGMLWNSRLVFIAFAKDVGVTGKKAQYVPHLEQGIDTLIDAGARVLLISFAMGLASNEDEVSRNRVAFRKYLSAGQGNLIVQAAGNDSVTFEPIAQLANNTSQTYRSATGRALAQLVDSFPSQIIFVSAIGKSGRILPLSNHYSGVSAIAAPGDSIVSLVRSADYDGATTKEFFGDSAGTSLAAPFVAGTALGLFSMVPSLTGSEVGEMILATSVPKRWDPDVGDSVTTGILGLNYLDAYRAARQVATRPNAPLCGNRVWTENLSTIKVRRGTSVEVLPYTSPDTIGVLFLPHGGRRIQFNTYSNGSAGLYRSLDYAAGGWIFSPGTSTYPDSLSGTTNSLFRRTHDADSATGPAHYDYYGANTSRPTGEFAITLGTSPFNGRTLFSDQRSLVLPGNFISTRRDAKVDTTGAFLGYVERTEPQFQKATNTYQQMNIVPVPSPLNDRVYFAINRYSYPVISQTDWVPGPNATPIGNEWSYQERYVSRNFVSLDTELWSVPWAGGAAQKHWGRAGQSIRWFGLAEYAPAAGHEAVMAIGTVDAQAAGPTAPYVDGIVQCQIEYMLIAQQFPTESPRAVPPATCYPGSIEIPQIAPLKAGPRGFDPVQPPIPRIR
jgi:hypothetical protein